MDANTVPTLDRQVFQQKLQRLLILWTFSIWPMLLEGKRLIEDVYDVLQICKDQPDRWELIVGFVRGTHRSVEIEQKSIDPLKNFFTTRPGLHVWNEFTKRILDPAVASGGTDSATVSKSFDLPKNMTDAKLRKRLTDKHVFENTYAFCSYLKSALERQWDGVEGDLLNDSFPNLFYVRGLNQEIFVVSVYRSVGDQRWVVSAFRLGEGRWGFGSRVFPCAA